ncbi:putative signal transduction protein [Desulfamplus magnetovallimortis]|uniref:Putative signal transduction protein n=1 Tax=Desulfamplus magnetovallimortis TaxID=1246637 RepID=A0A1W1H5P2_9BACT|nr:HEAT repeat domain-containing protein [Desulfamplus magnetovallimortis]SLM27801.1 putative signal transduction protein [Desulfamplus magnetovallimortis]
MSAINPREFLDELIFCLKEEDIVKANALLQFITNPEINANFQKRALHELSKASERLVFPILEYLTTLQIPNPEIQESLYELILDKAYGNHDRIIKYIIKDDKRNRITYIKVAGDLILADAAPILEKLLEKSKDRDIIIQTAASLGNIRLQSSLPALIKLVESYNDTEIQKAGIDAIAQIGGKPAVDYLTNSITGDNDTDGLKIKALGEIQDQHALQSLSSLLESTNTNIRDAAIDHLIEIGGKAVPILTAATSDAGSDFMVHLITTLGYIKDPKALPVILDIMKTKPDDPNVRQAAYESMERIPSTKSAIALAVGIHDPVEAVRMSAARAMDKNISKVLVAGLKNIVREGNEDALNAVGALIDSEADNIFNFLLQEESFIRLSVKHVTTKADPKTRDHFLNILKKKNHQALADKIEQMVPKETKGTESKTAQIFVVDDSKMMLKLYENKLTGFGYTPTSFMFPEEALRQIYASKPDLVITDLNMPKMNGLQLAQGIRKKYSSIEIPIIMITTQSDVVESEKNSKMDKSQMGKAGINKVLHKPFSNEELQATIAKLLKK